MQIKAYDPINKFTDAEKEWISDMKPKPKKKTNRKPKKQIMPKVTVQIVNSLEDELQCRLGPGRICVGCEQ